jgi:predicted transcriptional regulator
LVEAEGAGRQETTVQDHELETSARSRASERALIDELLRHGIDFDKVASSLDIKSAAQQGKARYPKLVQVEAAAQKIAVGDDVVGERLEKLRALRDSSALNRQEFLFNVARVLAVMELEKLEAGTHSINIGPAIKAYKDAKRLWRSAVDVLASAILLPRVPFEEYCNIQGHDILTLAALFDLPMAAIALRQQILHPPEVTTGLGGNDGRIRALGSIGDKTAA